MTTIWLLLTCLIYKIGRKTLPWQDISHIPLGNEKHEGPRTEAAAMAAVKPMSHLLFTSYGHPPE